MSEVSRQQLPDAGTAPRVLMVDDDPQIVALVTRYLGRHGFDVGNATNGQQLRDALLHQHVDLVLLDLELPQEDGLAVLGKMRRQSHVPVIIVSGRGEPVERVVGLELGADDYVAKPFDLRELLARIRTVLRRSQAAPAPSQGGHAVAFDGLVLDLRARRLRDRDGRPVALTTGEFALLEVLVAHAQQVLARERLIQLIRGCDTNPFDRSIDMQVQRLRKKIERIPTSPQLIQTVRGAGYIFTADVRSRG